ncbi:MAG: ABC transporter ATP-binding protein [Chloroflexota bacterium]
MLTVNGLSYRHAGALRPSLLDVDLVLGDGEVLGVIGANDSGKTTLCLVLAGLAPRIVGGTLSGRLSIDGVDAGSLRMHDLPALVGIGFDDPATQLSGVAATVFEEVAFGPANLGVPRDELIDRTANALEALAISHLAERDPARLSGGQQQLVAIASILALRPRHVVLDEPTAQLDPSGTALVGDALERLAGQGVSILVVEHKTDLLARIASRVVALDGGRVVLEGPAKEVLADPALVDLGVAPPSDVRLRRALVTALLDPTQLEGARA